MKTLKLLSKATLLSFLSMVIVLVSCKSDDPEPEAVDNNPIVGSWQYVSVAPEVSGTSIPALSLIPTVAPCIASLVFKFESNNKVTASGCDAAVQVMAATGYITVGADTKWKVEGSKLKITNGSTVQELPINQQTNQLSITINTNTDKTTAAVNAVIVLKRI